MYVPGFHRPESSNSSKQWTCQDSVGSDGHSPSSTLNLRVLGSTPRRLTSPSLVNAGEGCPAGALCALGWRGWLKTADCVRPFLEGTFFRDTAWHHGHATSRVGLGLRWLELVPYSEVERSRHHREALEHRVGVNAHLEVRRKLQSERERSGGFEVPLNDRDLSPGPTDGAGAHLRSDGSTETCPSMDGCWRAITAPSAMKMAPMAAKPVRASGFLMVHVL
jgi:hypothetical protein